MSPEEKESPAAPSTEKVQKSETISDLTVEEQLAQKVLKAKELYSHGSRNFLVKSYVEAADELSQVCTLYEEIYGELSDELGMPYLLYAKSLIALALDDNKIIDVPNEQDDDDDDDDSDTEEEALEENGINEKQTVEENGIKKTTNHDTIIDSTDSLEKNHEENGKATNEKANVKLSEEGEVSSSDDNDGNKKDKTAEKPLASDCAVNSEQTETVNDGEKPTTSNGEATPEKSEDIGEEDNEAASNLQLAWEILELAAKIFDRQGECGLPNLAEVQTELANIEFENNILEASREDYEKALNIYKQLPNKYRRAMAEIYYKIGLTYLMQTLNKEGAASLKDACTLIEEEIEEIKNKPDMSEKDKNNIQDMEETKQEIRAKIAEIEETQAHNIAEVRAALDSYIKPTSKGDVDAGTSQATATPTIVDSRADISSSSKPTDISHLIKRKKPDDTTSEAEAAASASPAKRPAL